ncbi:MAG: hypothetical protein WCB11_30675 [Terriglobales bacterium]
MAKVKKSFAIFLTLALFAAARPIGAQEQPSKFEVYGGYSYARFNVNTSAAGGAPSETLIVETICASEPES